jgi:hypothetical protein
MSILDEIKTRCNVGDLFIVEPSKDIRAHRVAASERRTLYVSHEIHQFLESDRPLAGETQNDFNDFILNQEFDVALHLDHQFCFMARLDAPSQEVWEIRVYDTEPQLRFFGRFAKRNIFVALIGPVPRWKMIGRYERIKRQCIAEWRALFSYNPIIKGDDIHAYLSNVYLV